jgi:hypothetical protein
MIVFISCLSVEFSSARVILLKGCKTPSLVYEPSNVRIVGHPRVAGCNRWHDVDLVGRTLATPRGRRGSAGFAANRSQSVTGSGQSLIWDGKGYG